MKYVWDKKKEFFNIAKHGVDFTQALKAFLDPHRVITEDEQHSSAERRQFCVGYDGEGILTVRFTLRKGTIRIIGAGYWRKGKKSYEKKNSLHG